MLMRKILTQYGLSSRKQPPLVRDQLGLTGVPATIQVFFFHLVAPHKFYIGFRYVNPLTEDTIDQMERQVNGSHYNFFCLVLLVSDLAII